MSPFRGAGHTGSTSSTTPSLRVQRTLEESRAQVVLAYSGGLDTTTAIKWLTVEQGYDVIALNIDVGKSREQPVVESRGLAAGALKVRVIDAREDFIRYFAFPALAAGAMYQDAYPLATALARPLMAKLLVDVAHEEGATAVAHGCTGKGNDQVRFDIGIMTLDPILKIVAPTRENSMAREMQIEYLRDHGIDIPWGDKGPFSIDENIWGRSAEAGVLEDPWQEPPPEAYEWTRSPEDAPAEPGLRRNRLPAWAAQCPSTVRSFRRWRWWST